MRSHLATLPIPPKTPQHSDRTDPLSFSSFSSSSSGEEDDEEEEERSDEEEKALVYGLRENPKRSFRLADPEFSFAVDAGSVVQDRESETESRNPTRRRSKRAWKLGFVPNQGLDSKKPKLGKSETTESPVEPEPVSSVSDTWPEEDIAMCLVMLSRDTWTRSNEDQDIKYEEERSVDETCKKVSLSPSLEASPVERAVNKTNRKKIKPSFEDESNTENGGNVKIYECPFCSRVFRSGQALGGHKRSHLLNNSTTTTTASAAAAASSEKFQNGVIDLNLPAPPEDFTFSQHSAVSYAEFMGNTIKC